MVPQIAVENTEAILATLDSISLSALKDRIAAMPGRFTALLIAAAELMEPKAQFVTLPGRTIKTSDDLDAWLEDAKKAIQKALKDGPVILH